ncbi:MAG: YdcF family protein [Acidimicrobiales bacterium]|nr:YdcF family protein [Acidimicrobiales bacterium]
MIEASTEMPGDPPPGTITTGRHAALELEAEERRQRHRGRRWVLRGLGLVVLLLLAYVTVTFVQVWRASSRDDVHRADAIVVLGAAQYDGRPSPVLQARLSHGLDLYRMGLAPVIVVTGGRQAGDTYTEATSGYNWLVARGVPDDAIRKEVQGSTTYESLAATSRFLRDEGLDEVLLVTDGYHALRVAGIAREVGLRPHVTVVSAGGPTVGQLGRETAAVSMGRVISYRRLDNLLH